MSYELNEGDRADRSVLAIREKTTALLAGRAGIWDYDPCNDRLCYCLGAARAFGLPSDVRFGGLPLTHLAEVVHPEDRALYLSQVAPALKGGGRISVMFRTDPAAGSSRRLLVRGDVNLDDGGRDVHTSGVVVEIPADNEHRPGDASPFDERGGVSSELLTAVDHILAAKTLLSSSGASQETVQPLIDTLLMALGRTLAQQLNMREPK